MGMTSQLQPQPPHPKENYSQYLSNSGQEEHQSQYNCCNRQKSLVCDWNRAMFCQLSIP